MGIMKLFSDKVILFFNRAQASDIKLTIMFQAKVATDSAYMKQTERPIAMRPCNDILIDWLVVSTPDI